jgi:hypothetical protein
MRELIKLSYKNKRIANNIWEEMLFNVGLKNLFSVFIYDSILVDSGIKVNEEIRVNKKLKKND